MRVRRATATRNGGCGASVEARPTRRIMPRLEVTLPWLFQRFAKAAQGGFSTIPRFSRFYVLRLTTAFAGDATYGNRRRASG